MSALCLNLRRLIFNLIKLSLCVILNAWIWFQMWYSLGWSHSIANFIQSYPTFWYINREALAIFLMWIGQPQNTFPKNINISNSLEPKHIVRTSKSNSQLTIKFKEFKYYKGAIFPNVGLSIDPIFGFFITGVTVSLGKLPELRADWVRPSAGIGLRQAKFWYSGFL